jgi:hypothetical protein
MSTTATIREKAIVFLHATPNELQELADSTTSEERGEIARHLEGVAAGAAFASAYLSARYGEGCGDQGHKYAAKCANRAKRLVRKAFGYDNTPAITF